MIEEKLSTHKSTLEKFIEAAKQEKDLGPKMRKVRPPDAGDCVLL